MRDRGAKRQARIEEELEGKDYTPDGKKIRRGRTVAFNGDLGPFAAFVELGVAEEGKVRGFLGAMEARSIALRLVWAALAEPLLPAHLIGDLPGTPLEQLRAAADDWPPDELQVVKEKSGRRRVVVTVGSTPDSRRESAARARAALDLQRLCSSRSAGHLASLPGGERIGQALRHLEAVLEFCGERRTKGRRQPDHFAKDGPSAKALGGLGVGGKLRAPLLRWATLAVERARAAD